MKDSLFVQAIGKFLLGVVLVGLLVFVPAGTLAFSYGWLFMGILFIPMFAAGLVMLAKNPDLLRKRLQAKEEQADGEAGPLAEGRGQLSGFHEVQNEHHEHQNARQSDLPVGGMGAGGEIIAQNHGDGVEEAIGNCFSRFEGD